MRTHIVSDALPLSIDADLLDKLERASMPALSPDADAASIRVGVEGPQGELYRIIETTSVVEAVRMFEALKDLGLRPEDHRGRHGHKVMRVYRSAG